VKKAFYPLPAQRCRTAAFRPAGATRMLISAGNDEGTGFLPFLYPTNSLSARRLYQELPFPRLPIPGFCDFNPEENDGGHEESSVA